MSEALYRKYRPQTFEDVVGQTHIERTLKNAIESDKVSYALLVSADRAARAKPLRRAFWRRRFCATAARLLRPTERANSAWPSPTACIPTLANSTRQAAPASRMCARKSSVASSMRLRAGVTRSISSTRSTRCLRRRSMRCSRRSIRNRRAMWCSCCAPPIPIVFPKSSISLPALRFPSSFERRNRFAPGRRLRGGRRGVRRRRTRLDCPSCPRRHARRPHRARAADRVRRAAR